MGIKKELQRGPYRSRDFCSQYCRKWEGIRLSIFATSHSDFLGKEAVSLSTRSQTWDIIAIFQQFTNNGPSAQPQINIAVNFSTTMKEPVPALQMRVPNRLHDWQVKAGQLLKLSPRRAMNCGPDFEWGFGLRVWSIEEHQLFLRNVGVYLQGCNTHLLVWYGLHPVVSPDFLTHF